MIGAGLTKKTCHFGQLNPAASRTSSAVVRLLIFILGERSVQSVKGVSRVSSLSVSEGKRTREGNDQEREGEKTRRKILRIKRRETERRNHRETKKKKERKKRAGNNLTPEHGQKCALQHCFPAEKGASWSCGALFVSVARLIRRPSEQKASHLISNLLPRALV